MDKARLAQARALEEALQRALREGALRGAQAERQGVIADLSRSLLEANIDASQQLLERHGATEGLRRINQAAVEEWPAQWRTALGPLIRRQMEDAPLPTDTGETTVPLDPASNVTNRFLDDHMTNLTETITATTHDKIRRVILTSKPEDATRRLLESSEAIIGSRPDLIARTETTRANNAASQLKAEVSRVISTKTWTTAGDGRVRDDHRALDGATVDLKDSFSNGLPYPQEPNCRCRLTYGVNPALKGARV